MPKHSIQFKGSGPEQCQSRASPYQMIDSLTPTEVCSFSAYAYLPNFKSTSHKLTELFTPYMSNKEQS